MQIPHPFLVGDLLAKRAVARHSCLLLSSILPLHEAVALLQALQDLLLLIRVVDERRLVAVPVVPLVAAQIRFAEEMLILALLRGHIVVNLLRHLVDIRCVQKLSDVHLLTRRGLLIQHVARLSRQRVAVLAVVLLLISVVVVLIRTHYLNFSILN